MKSVRSIFASSTPRLVLVALLSAVAITCGGKAEPVQDSHALGCTDQALVDSYDVEHRFSIIEDGVETDTTVWITHKSGENYHMVSIHDGQRHEIVSIEGKTSLMRWPDSDWEENDVLTRDEQDDDDETSRIWSSIFFREGTACPNLDHLTPQSDENLDGLNIAIYSLTIFGTHSEYFVDEDGLLVRIERTVQTNSPHGTEFHVISFSGFGEPNIIIDPFGDISPAPTATPYPPEILARFPSSTPTPISTATATSAPSRKITVIVPPPEPTAVTPKVVERVVEVILAPSFGSPTPDPPAVNVTVDPETGEMTLQVPVVKEFAPPTSAVEVIKEVPVVAEKVTSQDVREVVKVVPVVTASRGQRDDPTPTPSPTAATLPKIGRIEKGFPDVTIAPDTSLILWLKVFDLEGNSNEALGLDASFEWSVNPSTATISDGYGNLDASQISFKPQTTGVYTITATLDQSQCADVCEAQFTVTVAEPSR